MRNNILFGKQLVNPYYIMTPSYGGNSAGILALHLLCHHLNMMGYTAFVTGFGEYDYKTKPGLVTPVLSDEIVSFHIKNKQIPIVIYPDVIKGNPLNSKCVVRYLLNYPGLLGGSESFPDDDVIFTYSRKIGLEVGVDASRTLFMPICNTDIFYPPKSSAPRKGSCFYASKYKNFYGGKLFDITNNSVEITRNLPNSQTTGEVAELLRKSEVFYAYEDTSLITEAILCGCPVVMIKSQFFDGKPLAEYELGSEGCTVDGSQENIENAKKTIPIAQQKFAESLENFWVQFDNFIATTQEISFKIHNNDGVKLLLVKKKHTPVGRIIKQLFFNAINIFRK